MKLNFIGFMYRYFIEKHDTMKDRLWDSSIRDSSSDLKKKDKQVCHLL